MCLPLPMNSNIFLGIDVFQRSHFMHLRSPVHRHSHLMLFLCLFILAALSPTGLPDSEGAQHSCCYN